MAVLISFQGTPHNILRALTDLDLLSNCVGQPDCYLNFDQSVANKLSFDSLPADQQEQARAWHELHDNGSGNINVAKIYNELWGFNILGLTNVL